jgi:proton-translocating NADH-quinone oxidoreductase chain N
MNLVLFIVAPLLAAFLAGALHKIPFLRKGWLPTLMLGACGGYAAFLLPATLQAPINETIVVAAPLGVNLYGGPLAILLILVISVFGIVLTSSPKLRRYYSEGVIPNVLTLLHFAGLFGLLLSGDLFNIFVFLEIVALSGYALTTLSDSTASLEGALKYLLAGAVASIFFLVGTALVYYHTGTLNLAQLSLLAPAIPVAAKGVIVISLLVALAIEAELFPLNLWVPDVYEGSGAALSGLFSAMTLKVTLYLLFRILTLFGIIGEFGEMLLWAGLISMTVAELGALKQTNLVRMLAYSSMAQAGLIIAGFSAGFAAEANGAVLFHMISHSAAKAGLFLIASLVLGSGHIKELAGIGSRNRFVGIAAVVLILSLLGLPPFSGFVGKLIILQMLLSKVGIGAVVLVLVASLVEAWYLLKLLSLIFQKETVETKRISTPQSLALIVPVIFIIFAGLFPKVVMKTTNVAVKELSNISLYSSSVLGDSDAVTNSKEGK